MGRTGCPSTPLGRGRRTKAACSAWVPACRALGDRRPEAALEHARLAATGSRGARGRRSVAGHGRGRWQRADAVDTGTDRLVGVLDPASGVLDGPPIVAAVLRDITRRVLSDRRCGPRRVGAGARHRPDAFHAPSRRPGNPHIGHGRELRRPVLGRQGCQHLFGHRVVRGQPVHLVDRLLAILLHPYGSLVLALVRGLLSLREVLRPLSARLRITRRHGTAYRGEAHGGSGDLVSRRSGEITQVVSVGDERPTPLTKSVTRLTDPVNVVDMAFEFVRCRLDGVARVPQRLARGFQILRVRPLDQIDQLVEVEVTLLEVGPIRDGPPE